MLILYTITPACFCRFFEIPILGGGILSPFFRNFINSVPPIFEALPIELGSSNLICLFFIKFPPHVFLVRFLKFQFWGDFAPPFQNFRNLVPPVFHLLLIELGSSNMICLFFIKFPVHIFVGFSKFKFCRGEFPPFSKIT